MLVQRERRLGSAPRLRSCRAKPAAVSASPGQRDDTAGWRPENDATNITSCAGALTDAGRSGLAAVVQESHVGQAVAVVYAAASLEDLCRHETWRKTP